MKARGYNTRALVGFAGKQPIHGLVITVDSVGGKADELVFDDLTLRNMGKVKAFLKAKDLNVTAKKRVAVLDDLPVLHYAGGGRWCWQPVIGKQYFIDQALAIKVVQYCLEGLFLATPEALEGFTPNGDIKRSYHEFGEQAFYLLTKAL